MDEYISRDELLNAINTNIAEAHNERCSQLLEAILNAPTADVVEVKYARWIEDGEYQICSECGEEHHWDEYRATYCEDCGAKMDGQ